MRAIAREKAGDALFTMLHQRLQALEHPRVVPLAQQVQVYLHQLAERLLHLSSLDAEHAQLPLRGLVERMAQLTILTLLIEQANAELGRGLEGTGRRKALVTQLYLHRHVSVDANGWAADEDTTALDYFDALVDWKFV